MQQELRKYEWKLHGLHPYTIEGCLWHPGPASILTIREAISTSHTAPGEVLEIFDADLPILVGVCR